MPRTLGTSLQSDTNSKLATPRYLIEIGVGGTIRHATGGDSSGSDISWNSNTWSKTNVRVSRISWENAAVSAFTLTYILAPNLLSTFTNITPGTSIKLYATAALSSYAGADDVVTLYDGEVNGGWTLRGHRFDLNVLRSAEWFPPWYGRPQDGFNDLTLPGVYQVAQDVFILERG